MKINRSFLTIFVTVIFSILLFQSVHAQTGNQSDITGPDTQEITTPTETPTVATPNNSNSNTNSNTITTGTVDRSSFDSNFQVATTEQAVQQFEELQAVEFSQQLGTDFFGEIASSQDVSNKLSELSETTGQNGAVLYVASLADRMESVLILPDGKAQNIPNKSKNLPKVDSFISQKNSADLPSAQKKIIRQVIPEANRIAIQKVAREFRSKITNLRSNKDYLKPAQQLYEWIIAPLEPYLKANNIKTLIFSLDSGLRSIPIAALYDGKQFVVEKYGLALIPSFSLTDTRYVSIANTNVLAIGISKSTEGQAPLPAVNVELTAVNNSFSGSTFLNEESTIETIKSISQKQHFGIIHLATHGEFKPGNLSNSYIQFWNNRLSLDKLKTVSKELGWNKDPKVELLVLSACKTAIGDEQTELGFAGLAIQAGVKTAMGSLWYVSDQGTLALMSKFYDNLKATSLKSESLRQAQLAMLKGEVRLQDGELILSEKKRIKLPSELANLGNVNLSHPYFWSAFTIIGNWN